MTGSYRSRVVKVRRTGDRSVDVGLGSMLPITAGPVRSIEEWVDGKLSIETLIGDGTALYGTIEPGEDEITYEPVTLRDDDGLYLVVAARADGYEYAVLAPFETNTGAGPR